MALDNKQRDALIAERGAPTLRLEFDVFADGQVSMWTHFKHGDNFGEMKMLLVAVKEHLAEFVKDEGMCPFKRESDIKL